jgi:hypothetical protein
MDITSQPKLQNEWLFLHFVHLDLYFPKHPLHDMNFTCMIMCTFVKFWEGNSIKSFWWIMSLQNHFQNLHGPCLSGFESDSCTVHTCISCIEVKNQFALTLHNLLISFAFDLNLIRAWLALHI